jgi:GDP-4-dehydro-6-deoxy-D-mannose reductase
MRVLLTGATGFVGRWLSTELEQAGHDVVAAPGQDELDLGGNPDLRPVVAASQPDAVAHLAAVSFGPDATRRPLLAERVNVGGTRALFAALAAEGSDAAVLVTSSSEVYGKPEPGELPITEAHPRRAKEAYGRSKVAQEDAALEAAPSRTVVITRAFNHIGPGQREVFVAPAMARRVLELKAGRAQSIPVGNLDVRRDIGDVRDVVRAYRLLLEVAVAGRIPIGKRIYNVATGRSIAVRTLVEELCEIAGVPAVLKIDPALVRAGEAPEIRGDASLLHALTGWAPEIPLQTSLRDLLAAMAGRAG